MRIGDREIGNYLLPYIVAEISCNHLGDINLAMELIEAARWAGAHAVKFQAYTPDTLTLDCAKPDFIVQEGLWRGRTLYELYSKAYTPWDWFPKLFKHAQKCGITCFASVFDPSSVDMLEQLGCPVYKIASMEIVDTPLIKYAAKTGKPMIISTGMANEHEIISAYAAAGSNNNVAFLHCTSEYPQSVQLSYLSRINEIRGCWREGADIPVGISDHTNGACLIPVAATAMGVAVIEKHLKLKGHTGSEDEAFSLNPDDFQAMVEGVTVIHEAMKPHEITDNPSRQLRRSLYAVADIAEGEVFTEANVRSIRPGFGLAPRYKSMLLGKKADKKYRKGDRIT